MITSCDLRKTCGYCKESYGRKVRTDGKGYQYLQSLPSFEKSNYCSQECISKGRRARSAEEARLRKIKQDRFARALKKAEELFLYAGSAQI